jgi:hypothetical protein
LEARGVSVEDDARVFRTPEGFGEPGSGTGLVAAMDAMNRVVGSAGKWTMTFFASAFAAVVAQQELYELRREQIAAQGGSPYTHAGGCPCYWLGDSAECICPSPAETSVLEAARAAGVPLSLGMMRSAYRPPYTHRRHPT